MPPNLHEQPTVIQGATPSATTIDTPAGDTLSIGSPSGEATPAGMNAIHRGMETEEAARASTIGVIFFLICSVTASWTPFLDGHPDLKIPTVCLLAWFGLYSLYVSWLVSVPERYTRRVFLIYGLSAVSASMMTVIYMGPFSPTTLAVTLGISFFGQGSDRASSWAICGTAIISCLILCVLIISGIIPDVGVFRGVEAGFSGRLFMTVMVPLVLLVTLMQARWSTDAVGGALETAVQSTMEASRRGVQLEEAQAELDRIAAAGGVLGQLSGRSVGWYKLGPLLGRGGSGEVYDAVDTRSKEEVAVKVLRTSESDDGEIVTRFQREGEIATRLVSPYVARVHHYGRAPSGTLFIAMERLDGSDLASVLRRKSRLDATKTQELVHDVCEGIADAHRMGIIHRDIKPHNIFRAQQSDGTQTWKVLDFGVSKLTASFATITQGCVVGTPQYMSPEQARGEAVDVRTDVYGIGAVLYRVLTGRPPMPGKGQAALFQAAHRRPKRPRQLAPEMSQHLEAVLALALAPKPTNRFQTVEALRKAFDQAMDDQLPDALLRRSKSVKWHTSSG